MQITLSQESCNSNYPQRIFTLLLGQSWETSRDGLGNNGKVHSYISSKSIKLCKFCYNKVYVIFESVHTQLFGLKITMSPKFLTKLTVVVILSVVVEIIPIQMQGGEDLKGNNIDGSQLNQCLSVSGRSEVGVCFGKELLNTLSAYDETDTFSLATGVSFVRDEKGPRSIGNFLDKDPMDIRYQLF